MTIDLTDIVFSEEVENLAEETSKILLGVDNPYNRILTDISQLSFFCLMHKEFPGSQEKRESLKNDILFRVSRLKDLGITGEKEAKLFIERITPKLIDCRNKLEALSDQYKQERKELIKSVFST